MAAIGRIIKKARTDKGMTQEELAQRLGLATITVRQYENGAREPKLDTLKKISSVLEVDIVTLYALRTEGGEQRRHEFFSEVPLDDPTYIKTLREATDTLLKADKTTRKLSIIRSLEKLNEKGQLVAVERVDELTKIPEYQNTEPPTELKHNE